jgi:hypothetical protein
MPSATFQTLCSTQELFDHVFCLPLRYPIRCGQTSSDLWTNAGNKELCVLWRLGVIGRVEFNGRRYSHVERRVCVKSFKDFSVRLE